MSNLLIRFFLFVCVCFLLLFYGCQRNITDDSRLVASSTYVVSTPSDYISVNDPIRVRFKQSLFTETEVTIDGITITPSIKGSWDLSDDILSFIPIEKWDYGTNYILRIDVGQMLDGDQGVIEIPFSTKPLSLSIYMSPAKMQIERDDIGITIEGEIQSNDFVDSSKVQNMLSADYKNDEVDITWSHTPRGKSHSFVISGISIPEEDSDEVEIKWNGHSLDQRFHGKESIVIQGKKKFEITDIGVVQQGSQSIEVHFSQPLNQSQNLEGLISIIEANQDLTYSISGNRLSIFPSERLQGAFDVNLSQAITSFSGQKLPKKYQVSLTAETIKPQVRKLGGGVIVPSSDGLTYTFEAVNLDSVDVEIFKIYENNILQFLQNGNIDAQYEMEQVGKIIHQEAVSLQKIKSTSSIQDWNIYELDLSSMVKEDLAAIYQIRIGFRPSYVSITCNDPGDGFRMPAVGETIMRYRYDYAGYQYSHESDPCYPAYYRPDNFLKDNIFFTDLAAIVKGGRNKQYNIATVSLSMAQSVGGVEVELFDYQQQLLQKITTSRDGFATLQLETKPAFATLKSEIGTAYVKLLDGNSLSVSDFNTGGTQSKKGVEGYIYTERGVYRPGDSIHVNFMLSPAIDDFPENHPVTCLLYDGRGKKVSELTSLENVGRIYSFSLLTTQNAPTGLWRIQMRVGDISFYKEVRVETIKPNRLRINLDFPDLISYHKESDRTIGLTSQWLHGTPASGLRSVVEANWFSMKPEMDGFSSYTFLDPARRFNKVKSVIFDEKLDQAGKSKIDLSLFENQEMYPGMIQANLTSRVFEKGGDYSENYTQMKISPYSHYVGVQVPENEWGYSSIKIGEPANFNVVVTDEEGAKAPNRKLTVGIYDVRWSWWYYSGQRYQIYEMNSASHVKASYKTTATTSSTGDLQLSIPTEELEYGRKMIRICDSESGHCTGDFFYASGWGSSVDDNERGSLTKLNFSSAQSSYEVGQTAQLSIPSEEGSRILISVEGDEGVLFQEWITGESGSTTYEFGVNDVMAPNVYAHVTLIQSYEEGNNDLPIRMYGVIPIIVENPATVLSPVISTSREFAPNEKFDIQISEENGEEMNYTVAIVDEGLLDLTNFQTPSPHTHFYAKRSLGVKTWDVYDLVTYGKGLTPDKIVAVGGDGEGESAEGSKKAIRFKPVVFTAGPFVLKKGEKRRHHFTMPNYIGSVRTMVVAKSENAYGHVEVSTPVKTALMVLPTIPRVLSPGEEVVIPASVFAMQDNIKNVTTTLETNELISVTSSTDKLSFSSQGEQVARMSATVNDNLGIAKVNVSATSGNLKASNEIEMDIRNPMPFQTEVVSEVLSPGESWTGSIPVVGMPGTTNGIIELSQIPAINLENRIGYLTRYPYGCIEQTTSAAFPQLYLTEVTNYMNKDRIDKNVTAAIKRIGKMQSGGGFRYWPGSRSSVHSWGTSYAGHFLIEAKQKGYFVSENMLSQWAEYQEKSARTWRQPNDNNRGLMRSSLIDQAYRLYTLSLYGRPATSSMNILRMESELPSLAKFLLAASYGMIGKKEIALDLIQGASLDVPEYEGFYGTFGSKLRDIALIAQTMSLLDRNNEAASLIKDIAEELNSNKWYSTQSLAHGLLAVGKYLTSSPSNGIRASLSVSNGTEQNIDYNKSIFAYSLDPFKLSTKTASITNNSNSELFISIQSSGQPSPKEITTLPAKQNHVVIDVRYQNLNGEEIDPSSIEQGTDFKIVTTIRNLNTRGTTIENMALTHIIPSGWEIRSGRLSSDQNSGDSSYDYRDVRDDRVHTFFTLGKTATFTILANATYEGKFYLPPLSVDAMYDGSISANTKGAKVSVVRARSL